MTPEEIEQVADKVAARVVEEVSPSILDPAGRGLLLHFTEHEILGGALIVDEARAKASPCSCMQLDDGRTYCFTRGAVGMLSQEQMEGYCPAMEYTVGPGMKQQFEKFSEAAGEAHKSVEDIPAGERMEPWLQAMSGELGKRGIEV